MPPIPPDVPHPSAEGTSSESTSTPAATSGAAATEQDSTWRARLRRAWPYLRWPVYATSALLVLVLVAGAWLWATTDLPPAPSIAESAVLVDRNGEELAVLAQEGLRLEAGLDQIAPVAVDALLAAEDRRFYDHTGIDPAGIVRAFWNNLRDDDTEGGSTITQQLVKNTYLDNDRTVSRKLREAVLAVKLERSDDKDEILERYLNTVYFGRGAYGIEAAARNWFDRGAGELTAPQAALLAGILRAPEALDPTEEPDAALARRDAVLDAMAAMGTLTDAEAREAKDTPIEVTPEAPSTTILRAGVAPHYVEHVRARLVEQFGEQALYDRGLVVHTTLDIADQRAAEAAVATHLDDPSDPQAALVAVDRAGAVRAWVGGRDYEALQVDLVTSAGGSGRQPGSTFKPLTLAAYLDDGNSAGDRYRGPAEITLDAGGPEPWEVSNAGGSAYGSLTLADATVNSVNTVYAQAVLEIGPDEVVDMANRLGVERELQDHASIALGAQEVTPLEMATAYSTLARSGERIDPYTIQWVEDRAGNVLYEAEIEPEQVVDEEVADTVSAVLEETPRRGTARRAALDRPMAAKTGTTQRNADAWLAGYTPEYTAIVWIGNAEGNEPLDDIDGMAVQGGTVPAMIWHDFMVEAVADLPPTPFPEPDRSLLRSSRSRDRDRERRAATRVQSTEPAPSTTTTSEPDEEEDGEEGEDEDGEQEDNSSTSTTAPDGTTSTTAPTSTTTAPTTTAPPTTEAAQDEPAQQAEATSSTG